MDLRPETIDRAAAAQKRLMERGVLDIKFFKRYPHYTNQTPDEQMNALCEIIEAMLDGKHTPHPGFGDSVRDLDRYPPDWPNGGTLVRDGDMW